MFTAAFLAANFLYLRAFARRGSHRKQSYPSIVASIRVYRAVAWQRVDQIHVWYVTSFKGIKFNLGE
jgi:hypothetical protein